MKDEDVQKLTNRRYRVPAPEVRGPWIKAQRLAFTPILTQSQLARMAKVSRRNLQRIERNECVPSADVLYRIWRVLDTLRIRGLKLRRTFKDISEDSRPYVRTG